MTNFGVMAISFFVYGLVDSADWSRVRYVGAASRLGRPACHVRNAWQNRSPHKDAWIKKVQAEGRHVGWRILKACDTWEDTLVAERRIIQHLRGSGHDLTNLTDGGQGIFNPCPETRRKKSIVQKEVMSRPEFTSVVSARTTELWADPVGRANFLRPMAAANARPDVQQRRSDALVVAFAKPEVKAKRSEAQRASWAERRRKYGPGGGATGMPKKPGARYPCGVLKISHRRATA